MKPETRKIKLNRLWFMLQLVFIMASCKDEVIDAPNNGKPFISTIEPASGRSGNTVRVIGGNFSKAPQENEVFFNGIPAEVSVGIDEELLVKVPSGATSGQVSIFVPGHEPVQGPVFTIEEFISPTIYWLGGYFNKATFDEEGNPVLEEIYQFPPEKTVLSMQSYMQDTEHAYVYLSEYTHPDGTFILRLDYATGTLETLYDPATDPQCASLVISRLVLDVPQQVFYATATKWVGNQVRYCIVKGALDGNVPLTILYETTGTAWGIALADNYLYWVDGTGKKILRASLAAFNPETLYDAGDGLTYPKEIVVDESSNRLFFTDDPFAVNGIIVDRLLQGSRDGIAPVITLLQGEDDNVWDPQFGLALDPANNILFWITKVRNQTQSERFMQVDLKQEVLRPDILFEVGLNVDDPLGATPIWFTVDFSGTD